MNAKRSPFISSCGTFWPSYFCRVGFGSSRSTWDGAPAMNRKIMLLAFAGNMGASAQADWQMYPA